MKKIIAVLAALAALTGTAAFASEVQFEDEGGQRAVIMCYDNSGKLVYSDLLKSEDGKFTADIPAQYDGFKKKAFLVSSKEIISIDEAVSETDAPAVTKAPEATAAPTETPKATLKPVSTERPKHDFPSVYKREADSIYGMSLVKEVNVKSNAQGEDIYAVTVFYNGKELTAGVDTDVVISAAPEAHLDMVGKTMLELEEGDVVVITADVSGTTVRDVKLVFRPEKEDLVTGSSDYGDSFEKLCTYGGKVGGTWGYAEYGKTAPSDKITYAFGAVALKNDGLLTLVNKNPSEDNMLELDIRPDTLVYTCDVSGKEYELEIADVNGIETTIPSSMFYRGEPIVLDKEYSYNYALARMVDGTVTELILYNNYNN